MDDRAVVSWQLGRPARPVRRVAVRCAHGYPAVTEQPAFTPEGEPFPTTYYLTCPWLVAAISRLEAEGGVARWRGAVERDPELAESVARADAEQRRIRPELEVGIAGARDASAVKCLHAHAAFALARPGYELGERIVAEAGERWCPDGRCAKGLSGNADSAAGARNGSEARTQGASICGHIGATEDAVSRRVAAVGGAGGPSGQARTAVRDAR